MKTRLICVLSLVSFLYGCSVPAEDPVPDLEKLQARKVAQNQEYQMQQLENPDPDVSMEAPETPVQRGAESTKDISIHQISKKETEATGGGTGWGGIGIGGGRGTGWGGIGGGGGLGGPMAARGVRESGRLTSGPGRGRPDFDSLRNNPDLNTESYQHLAENPFLAVVSQPLSTFSVDVDTASYSNVRRFIQAGQKVPADAVRIEEMINYFSYRYASPGTGRDPFSVDMELTTAPWAPAHMLARIAVSARPLDVKNRKPANLVFLVDVSGSMSPPNRLPLVQRSMRMLVDHLGPADRVAIVVYAGSEGLALPSTPCNRKSEIILALDRLHAGGTTNGGAGIELAYRVARENFIPGGINRIILATDGDFNVGVTSKGELLKLVEKQAKSNIFLTVLGFGMGNYKDSMLEELSNRGNGNYAYIDHLMEAKRVLVSQFGGTLVTVAKDVKLQVEFNPKLVSGYRLIGYENRLLAARDFNDDQKDAGEIGAGHTVTALYELIPAGMPVPGENVDPLRYQTPPGNTSAAVDSSELMMVKVRYKDPEGDTSRLLQFPVENASTSFGEASENTRFAVAVAGFGMLLKESKHAGDLTFEQVLLMAEKARGADPEGYRGEFLDLVRKASGRIKGE